MNLPLDPLARAALLIRQGRELNDRAAMRDEARALIKAAQAKGWDGPEPSMPDAYEDYLLTDADEARDFLRALDEPDRCTECGAVQLCDCRVSMVPRC